MKIFVCEAGVSMRVSERWKNLMQSKIEGESDRRIRQIEKATEE